VDTTASAAEFDVEVAMVAAFAADGYLKEDASGVDMEKVRSRMLEVLLNSKVTRTSDRTAKATTRGVLTREVLPSLPSPDKMTGADAVNAKAVRVEADKKIWNETRPDGPLQRKLGISAGNGYMMLRTKVDLEGNTIDAVYISDGMQLIQEDLLTPTSVGVDRKAQQAQRIFEMVQTRHPDQAAKIAKTYHAQLKSITEAGFRRLMLTAEAVSTAANGHADDDPEDEG